MPPPFSHSYSMTSPNSDYQNPLNSSAYGSSQYESSRRSTRSSIASSAFQPSVVMSSSHDAESSSIGARSTTWQDKLESYCREMHKPPPQYSIVSDRRGKRTAWSCTVTVPGGPTASAIYWYDGQHVNGAKEDAAEVAWRMISGEGRRGSGSTGKVEAWGRRT